MTARGHILAAPALLGAIVVAAACFSDRRPVTAPTGGECQVPLAPGVPGSTLVVIQNFSFQPPQIRIRAGATVTWVNCDPSSSPAHTTTSDGGVWASPLLSSAQAFSHTFNQAGTFSFHCEPHPFMTATVIVE